MKHRKSLLLSILGIAIGIILWFSGAIVNHIGIIYHYGGTASGYYEYTTVYYVGIGLGLSGVILLILGVFGIIITIMRENLDREHKTIQSPPLPPPPS